MKKEWPEANRFSLHDELSDLERRHRDRLSAAGSGPGLILVHGGMAASQQFMKLASSLADVFTVYIPDRRGRGMSGPFGDTYGIWKGVDDMDALLTKTGAHNVFGLSSVALISLQAALVLPAIYKAALYERPLSIDHSLLESMMPAHFSFSFFSVLSVSV